MNFTREPIIETVITPKEGFKLVLRNSGRTSSEEAHLVNSVEVVSFGKAFFFRSLEKPRAFLLPVTDYEVLEMRETRTVLKKPKIEKSIKIGGGSKAKRDKESSEEKESAPERAQRPFPNNPSRRRRSASKEEEDRGADQQVKAVDLDQSKRCALLPPPTSLISEQISRYKNYLVSEGTCLPEELEEGNKLAELPQEAREELLLAEENIEKGKMAEIDQETATFPKIEE